MTPCNADPDVSMIKNTSQLRARLTLSITLVLLVSSIPMYRDQALLYMWSKQCCNSGWSHSQAVLTSSL